MWKTWVGLENEMTVSSNAAGNHGKIIKNLSPNFPPRKSALKNQRKKAAEKRRTPKKRKAPRREGGEDLALAPPSLAGKGAGG
jgi:hypothetical protein